MQSYHGHARVQQAAAADGAAWGAVKSPDRGARGAAAERQVVGQTGLVMREHTPISWLQAHLAALLLASATALDAHSLRAEPPSEGVFSGPHCSAGQPSLILFGCGLPPWGIWVNWVGQTVWGPLQYAGQFQVSIQAKSVEWLVDKAVPLYVEIRVDEWASQCRADPGVLYWWTDGTPSCAVDSMWVTSPPIELPVPVGTTYWLQLVSFFQDGSIEYPRGVSSPYVRDVRVTRDPTAVLPSDWGFVKSLYR